MKKRMAAMILALVLILMPLASLADSFNYLHPIAYMDSHFTCGCSRGGSGVMIGRYGLVTAAHNLYCHTHGKPLKYCNFYFGAKSVNSCWYQYSGNFHYTVYENFSNGYQSKNDIGYVIFDYPVGKETGWYGYLVGTDYDLNEEYTHVEAYDSKRHIQSVFSVQYVASDTEIYWDGYTSGAEGGPVYFWYEGMEYPQVVAVYTSHDSDGNGYGRRLTKQVINDMRADGAFN